MRERNSIHAICTLRTKRQLPDWEYFSENPGKVRTQAQVVGILVQSHIARMDLILTLLGSYLHKPQSLSLNDRQIYIESLNARNTYSMVD